MNQETVAYLTPTATERTDMNAQPKKMPINLSDIEEAAADAKPLDPGVTTEQHATSRMKSLVADLNGGTRKILTEHRDLVDTAMTAVDSQGDALINAVNAYAATCQAAVQMVGINKEYLERIVQEASKGITVGQTHTLAAE